MASTAFPWLNELHAASTRRLGCAMPIKLTSSLLLIGRADLSPSLASSNMPLGFPWADIWSTANLVETFDFINRSCSPMLVELATKCDTSMSLRSPKQVCECNKRADTMH
jgi:hypothetical protein